jgi:hypothetical protein
MTHVDDGRLNALLDGELESGEAEAVRAHVAECPDCARRLEEAKRFLHEAADLLGALEPSAGAAAPEAGFRPSRTAKEVAIDLDGTTQQSPAIRPDLPGEGGAQLFRARAPRRRFDYTSLAWAATIVLAIGVGFLANEVRHAQTVVGTEAASPAAGAPAASEIAPAGSTAAAQAAAAPTSAARQAPRSRPGTVRGRQPESVLGHKRLLETPRPAAGARGELGRAKVLGHAAAAAPAPGPATTGGADRGRAPAADATNRVALPAAASTELAAAARAPAAAEPKASAPRFHRATLEEAVTALRGAIRLIDGMQSARVEVGPGALVAGANRDRVVVRVLYSDAGRPVMLEQQRVRAPGDTTSAVADVGQGERPMLEEAPAAEARPEDTLLTREADGSYQLRWVDDDGFWLSLTARMSADALRRLAARVR